MSATLKWRTDNAGVRLTDINKAVAKMVKVAKATKDLNGNGEAERFELAKATAKHGKRFADTMEAIRYGTGFYNRDALPGGNPYFSHNEFVQAYSSMTRTYKSMDKDKDGVLDVKELKGANSKMNRAMIEYVNGG